MSVWTKVANVQELNEGQMIQVQMEYDDVAIYRTEEGIFATSDVCTHASESLSQGTLDGHIVQCPKHGGKFDVRTGAAAAFPCVRPLETYGVEIRGDEIWLDYD